MRKDCGQLWEGAAARFRSPFSFMANYRCAVSICVLLWSVSISYAQILVTDIAGRQVTLAAPAERVILEMPASYSALSILSRHPADIVVGIGGTPNDSLSEIDGNLAAKPRLGWAGSQTFSIEAALSLKPDLFIATHRDAGLAGQHVAVAEAFEKAGVPVIYVDFSRDPLRHTAPSIETIGKAIGEEKRAAEYIDFYRDRVTRLSARLEAAQPVFPKLMQVARVANDECCWSWAGWGILKYYDILRVANVADGKVPNSVGLLGLEFIIESNPEIVVISDWSSEPDSVFGRPRTVAQAVATLERLSSRPGLRDLAAMRDRRVHAIDQYLMMYSPLNVLALEVLAKWAHPNLFSDLDPQATLDEINERFLATPLKGPLWASLDPDADMPAGQRP